MNKKAQSLRPADTLTIPADNRLPAPDTAQPASASSYTVTSTANTQAFPGHSLGEFRNGNAFAVIKANGAVVTWGGYGGDSSAVASQLDGTVDVTQIFSNSNAFAALRADGSVVTWGGPFGGDSRDVAAQLDCTVAVTQVFSTSDAFAALRADG